MPAVPRLSGASAPSASLVQKRAYERSNCALHSDIYHASKSYVNRQSGADRRKSANLADGAGSAQQY